MAKIIDLVTNAGQVDVTKGIVEEALLAAPEMEFFDSDTVPGTTIETLAPRCRQSPSATSAIR